MRHLNPLRRWPIAFAHRNTTFALILLLASIALSSPAALPAASVTVTFPAPTAQSKVQPSDGVEVAGSEELEAQEKGNLELRQNTYAPFSGAIYIVNGQGVAYNAGSPAQCPAAGQVCGAIQAWNCCCPTGSVCQYMSNNQVGCCPAGSACQGHAQPSTITMTVTTTVWGAYPTQIQTRVQTTATAGTWVNGVFVVGGVGIGVVGNNAPTTAYWGSFCSTLTMRGNAVPAVAQGSCGQILIVPPSAASSTRVQWSLLSGLVLLQVLLGLFWK